jgi:hypothetical protein
MNRNRYMVTKLVITINNKDHALKNLKKKQARVYWSLELGL